MDGFGIVLIDDSDEAKHLYKPYVDSGYDIECFKNAKYLNTFKALSASVILTLFT